jgi:hypothetical protein
VGRVSYEPAIEFALSEKKEALPGEVLRSEGRTRIQQGPPFYVFASKPGTLRYP